MKPANYHVATVWVQMTPGNTSALSPLTLRKRGTDYRASDVPTPGRPFPSNQMQKRRAILSFLTAPGPGLPHRHSSPARLAGSLLSTHFRACRQFLSPGHLGTSHGSFLGTGEILHLLPLPSRQLCLRRRASPGPFLLYSAPKKSTGSTRLSLD